MSAHQWPQVRPYGTEQRAVWPSPDPTLTRAKKLWPDSDYLQREWLRAVRLVRRTRNGWRADPKEPSNG